MQRPPADEGVLRVPPSRVWTDWPMPKRVLARIPNWVGDVVMATPALRALKKGLPGAEIWVEGKGHMKSFLLDLPYVDHYLDDPGKGFANTRARIDGLKKIGFDLAVLFPDSPRSAWGPFRARIPMRLGYSRELLRRSMLTHALHSPGEDRRRVPVSMIDRYLVLPRALGLPADGEHMDVAISDGARTKVAELLAGRGVDGGTPLVTVIPGAAFGASKMWPVEHFAKTLDLLYEREGLQAILPTGPGEQEIAKAIAGHMQSPAVLMIDPILSLEQVAALVERSRLVLSNDTGPRQFAVALGIPVVVPIGPTDQRTTQHHLERQRVLIEPVDCRPCCLKKCPIDHRCMTRITPERAFAASQDLLQTFPAGAAPLAPAGEA
ncbi:MAG: lipopolysaccharide heptosyltransferase II [Planctomycetota bacterium]